MVYSSVRRWRRLIWADSLYRNSLFLLANTVVSAGFGFLFWVIVARRLPSFELGLATTLIAALNVVSLLSLFGFDTTLVRFLPTAPRKNESITLSLAIVGTACAVIGSLGVIALPVFLPSVGFLHHSVGLAAAFVFFGIMTALNTLTDVIFLAYRKAHITLLINLAVGIAKISLPFALAGRNPQMVLYAAGLAQSAGLFISLAVLARTFEFKPVRRLQRSMLREISKYNLGNYGAGLLNLIPIAVLPIIIARLLTPDAAAYFYVVMMLSNVLYMIPFAAAKSLLAESSHNEAHTAVHLRRTILFMLGLLTPAIAFLIVGGSFILHIFGSQYAANGLALLRITTLAVVAVAAYSLVTVLLKLRQDIAGLLHVDIIYAVLIVLCSAVLVPVIGLSGAGLAWLLGHGVASIYGWWRLSLPPLKTIRDQAL